MLPSLRHFLRGFTLVLLFGSTYIAFGQGGALDPTFNPGDLGLSNGEGANNTVLTSVVQPDGKIIIGGSFTAWNNISRNRIARLNADGSLDASFNPGTGANSTIRSIALQPDGKILIGGQFTTFNGVTALRLLRLNSDGTIDPAFNATTGADNGQINAIALQPDGKAILGGSFTYYDSIVANRIVRINVDGTLDPSFVYLAGFNQPVMSLALQPDGKVLAGGQFTSYAGTARNRIIRINADGSNDVTFAPGSAALGTVQVVALQPDGKILIGGDFTSYAGTTGINRIARLNAVGTLDGTFASGTGANSTVFGITIQPDGNILISGNFATYNANPSSNVVRVTTTGSFDATFVSPVSPAAIVYTMQIVTGGKIFMGGNFQILNGMSRWRAQRLFANGSVDLTFNPGSAANAAVNTTAVQSDGKIVLGGAFQIYNGVNLNYLARANSDGSVDGSFNIGTGANAAVNSVLIQPDGNIVAGGVFSNFNGTSLGGIVRLTSAGSIDPGFLATGAGAGTVVNVITRQPDGKLLVGGTFTSFNGSPASFLVRLNADGTTDATFNTGAGFDAAVNVITVQPDGKILVGGAFVLYNGTTVGRIVRLNTDGSIDGTFVGTAGDNTVNAIYVLPDNRIMVGGAFTLFNGSAIQRMTRLTATGGIDPTFLVSSTNNTVRGFAQLPDGKLLVHGDFTSVQGVGRNRIARLMPSGQTDQSFNPGTVNNSIYTLSLLPNGRYIVGGLFTNYRGIGRNRIAKGISCDQNLVTHTVTACDSYTWINGVTYYASTNSPVVYYTNVSGCDSNFYLNLTIKNSTVQDVYVTACNSYTLANTTYFASGTYTEVLTSVAGCDSTINLHLTINQSTSGTQNTTACGSYTWPANGMTYTSSGSYMDTLTNANGCDSIVTLNLTINQTSSSTQNVIACNTYTWSATGSTYSTDGTYTTILPNANGCDSVLTLNLTINDTVYNTIVASGCGSVNVNGQSYTTSGTYVQWLTTGGGCDSMLTVVATVDELPIIDSLLVYDVSCNGDSTGSAQVYVSGGTSPYSVSWSGGTNNGFVNQDLAAGSYSVSVLDDNGCSVSQNFTVNQPAAITGTVSFTSCDPITLNNQTYANSGIFQQVLQSVNGCDSTLTVNITILNPPTATASDDGTGLLTAGAASYYQWYNCSTGQNIPGATEQTYTAMVNGSFAVIASNGYCSDTSACVAVNYLDLNEVALHDLNLYPNPATSQVILEFSEDVAAVTITDNSGKVLRVLSVQSGEQIDISELVPGAYFFAISTEAGSALRKVVKI